VSNSGFIPHWLYLCAILLLIAGIYDYLSRPVQVADVEPAAQQEYRDECGACHFAYPPGLLPSRSWNRLLATLAEHFDENVELDPEPKRIIQAYLNSHGAEHASSRLSREVMASLEPGEAPIRITTGTWFLHKHHEVPEQWVEDNPDVVSFSSCDLCHKGAERGRFRAGEVEVPGRSGR